jgi:hypothetical protein
MLGCAVLLVVACTGRSEAPADSAGAMGGADTGMAMGAGATTRADLAGNWDGRSMEGDSVVATWRMTATADTTGWTLTFPEGRPIPMRVLSMAGDSIVTEFGPFESPVTKQQVRVRGVGRMEGRDRQVGTYEVRPVAMPDSVTRGRWEATRVP